MTAYRLLLCALPALVLTLSMILPAYAQTATATDAAAYRDAARPLDERVDDLLARMTLEEKVGQMTQLTLQAVTQARPAAAAGPSAVEGGPSEVVFDEWRPDPEKLREALVEHHVGSLLNVGSHAYDLASWHELITQIQDVATQETRLGIPVLYGIDAVHGHHYLAGATLFPHNLALAATFDPELVRRASEITARETRASGIPWNFAPVLDVGRQPLWGRFYETFGEDVLVTSRLGVAAVEGNQGDDLTAEDRVAVSLKHFLGYSAPIDGKDRTSAHIPERVLREVFVPPFRAAIDAGARTVMINSGDVNGVPVHASHELLTGLLRDELGFEGLAVSDWEDIIKLHTVHRVAPDEREATRMAVEAGVDMSMVPMNLSFYDHLLSLAQAGEVDEARIDEAVRRILRLKFELGLFENPYPPALAAVEDAVRTDEADAVNRAAADRSIVLLKNEGVLPLRRDQKVLVTGPAAHSLRALNGGWTYSWQGQDTSYFALYPDARTILEAVRDQGAEVTYVPGSGFTAPRDLEAAVAVARAADVAVVAVGETAYAEKPGDIDDLALDAPQLELIEAVAATGTPVVLVLVEGRPRLITAVEGQVEAVVGAFLPGNRGGEAVARVLYGEVNPSGRLPFTYPKAPNHLLPYDHPASSETGVQFAGPGRTGGYDPLYPFGHGLSYTTFAYRDLTLSSATLGMDGTLTATVTVENTGDRAGEETVLLYTRDLYASIVPAVRRLRGFERVALAPGEAKTVTFTLTPDDLAFVGRDLQRVAEPGTFEVHVGGLVAPFELE